MTEGRTWLSRYGRYAPCATTEILLTYWGWQGRPCWLRERSLAVTVVGQGAGAAAQGEAVGQAAGAVILADQTSVLWTWELSHSMPPRLPRARPE